MSQEARFFCKKYPDHKLLYKSDQHGYTIDQDGRQVVMNTQAEFIEFKNHFFKTADPKKIEFLRNHGNFTGVGDIKLIAEVPPPDPNQQKLQQFMQQLGAGQLVNIVESVMRSRGQSAGAQTVDPVAATLAYQQQQLAQQQPYQPIPGQNAGIPQNIPMPVPNGAQQAQIQAMQGGAVVPFDRTQVPPQSNVVR